MELTAQLWAKLEHFLAEKSDTVSPEILLLLKGMLATLKRPREDDSALAASAMRINYLIAFEAPQELCDICAAAIVLRANEIKRARAG